MITLDNISEINKVTKALAENQIRKKSELKICAMTKIIATINQKSHIKLLPSFRVYNIVILLYVKKKYYNINYNIGLYTVK